MQIPPASFLAPLTLAWVLLRRFPCRILKCICEFQEIAPAHFFFEASRVRGWLRAITGAIESAMAMFARKPDRNSVIVATILGAAIGSKLLGWLEDPAYLMHGLAAIWPGGKTIVGGLLGGTIAVEFEKRRLGIAARAGRRSLRDSYRCWHCDQAHRLPSLAASTITLMVRRPACRGRLISATASPGILLSSMKSCFCLFSRLF